MRLSSDTFYSKAPNKAAAVNAPIASLFRSERPWWRVTELRRWAANEPMTKGM